MICKMNEMEMNDEMNFWYMKWMRWKWLDKYVRLKEESFICLYERILVIGETVWFLRIKSTVSKIMLLILSYLNN